MLCLKIYPSNIALNYLTSQLKEILKPNFSRLYAVIILQSFAGDNFSSFAEGEILMIIDYWRQDHEIYSDYPAIYDNYLKISKGPKQ